jgi:hypothetical protein
MKLNNMQNTLKKRNSAPKIIEEAPTEREVTEEVKKF